MPFGTSGNVGARYLSTRLQQAQDLGARPGGKLLRLVFVADRPTGLRPPGAREAREGTSSCHGCRR